MIARCKQAGLPTPEFRQEGGQFIQKLSRPNPAVTPQVGKVLDATANEARSREELQTAAGMMDREHFRKAYVEPLVTAGWLERTIPDKPTSRLQKYRLTTKGRDWLVGEMKGGAK